MFSIFPVKQHLASRSKADWVSSIFVDSKTSCPIKLNIATKKKLGIEFIGNQKFQDFLLYSKNLSQILRCL
jgi:hypothetical protein